MEKLNEAVALFDDPEVEKQFREKDLSMLREATTGMNRSHRRALEATQRKGTKLRGNDDSN